MRRVPGPKGARRKQALDLAAEERKRPTAVPFPSPQYFRQRSRRGQGRVTGDQPVPTRAHQKAKHVRGPSRCPGTSPEIRSPGAGGEQLPGPRPPPGPPHPSCLRASPPGRRIPRHPLRNWVCCRGLAWRNPARQQKKKTTRRGREEEPRTPRRSALGTGGRSGVFSPKSHRRMFRSLEQSAVTRGTP